MGCMTSKISNISQDIYYYSRDECCICLDDVCCVLILPCSHFCMCYKCASSSYLVQCPMCQTPIESYNYLKITPAT